MTRTATALLVLAIGVGVAHSAEKAGAANDRPTARKEKPANADGDSQNEFSTKFKPPQFELPGGFTGTFGTVEPPKDPFQPGYTGPGSDPGPSLPPGGLILKKEF